MESRISAAHAAASRRLPGGAVCVFVALAAWEAQSFVKNLAGGPYLDAVVLSILFGSAVRTFWIPGIRWIHGIDFCARTLLEIAVALLGASISVQALAEVGPVLVLGIAIVVLLAIAASYPLSRLLGLPHRLAILLACGNSICGNSAIVAVAPVIGATSEEVTSAVAFTAILGVALVILLPFLIPFLALSLAQYGLLAGLTVYAVPQVLAATIPVGVVSTQVGTLVKLVRVLMLGPVLLLISMATYKANRLKARAGGCEGDTSRTPVSRILPWYIVGFLLLAGLRSAGFVPEAALRPLVGTATVLTVISMAALGLGVDVRVLRRIGLRTSAAALGSLVILGALSLGLIHFTRHFPS